MELPPTETGLPDMTAPSPGDDGRSGGPPQLEDYEITAKIGEHGQGVVWRAVQLSTNRDVAVKCLRTGPFGAGKAMARFEREIECAARLSHPNVTKIFDSGLRRGMYFYAMEYIPGLHLDDYVRANGLSPRQIVELVLEVCRGVEHAHQHGVMHRDLKPANILVTEDARPHILDFGLAKAFLEADRDKEVTIEGDAPGTPAYMSPEQADGRVEELDSRTDVYSLGAVLYELLTGRLPHDTTGTVPQVRQRIAHEPIVRPRSAGKPARKYIDGELEALLVKALERDPEDRYGSATELAGDMERYLKGEPLTARPANMGYYLRLWCRRHRRALSIAAAVLAVVAGVAAFAYGQVLREEQARRRETYFRLISLAALKYRNADTAHVRELLESCPADLRGWGWYRLRHVCDQSDRTLVGHTDGVFVTAFSPNGKRVLSAGKDGTIRLWNIATGKPPLVLRGHVGHVRCAAFSPDGKYIASGGADGSALLWDAETGKQLWVLESRKEYVEAVAFRPDSKLVALACEDDTVTVRDVQRPDAGPVARLVHHEDVLAVAFTADGNAIVSGAADGNATLWHGTGWKDETLLGKHVGLVYAVAASPDGRYAASAGSDQVIRLWDLANSGSVRKLEGHGAIVTSLAFTPDSEKLVSASWDQTLRIWAVRDGNQVGLLRGHDGFISSVAVSANGRWLVSGGLDKLVKLWPVAGRNPDRVVSAGREMRFGGRFSPDGRHVMMFDQMSGLQLRDARTARRVRGFRDPNAASDPLGAFDAAFTPDGKRVASAHQDGVVRVWDVRDGRLLRAMTGHEGFVPCVAISPDGKWAVSGGNDTTLRKGSLHTGASSLLTGSHPARIWSVAFSSDGSSVITACEDGRARLCDLASGRLMPIGNVRDGRLTAAAYSPTGRQAAFAGDDGLVHVYDTGNWQAEPVVLRGHLGSILTVAFSPDGERILSGSDDGTIRLWDARTGAEAMAMPGSAAANWRNRPVWWVGFDPRGREVLSTSIDGTMHFWHSAKP